jgi:hypothetical protein
MKTLLMILILILSTLVSIGQIKPINFREIKSTANNNEYNKLYDRFITNDTSLILEDYIKIYYGQAFRNNYRPSARHDSVRILNMYLNRGLDSIDFNKVLNFSKLILKDYPFNIEEIFITAIAYNKLGLQDSSRIWLYKYDKLIRAIMSSGDGKTQKTAFIVTKVTDEYSIINALGLQFAGQALVGKKKRYYDQMDLAQNEYGIEKLYFDINLFFGLRR